MLRSLPRRSLHLADFAFSRLAFAVDTLLLVLSSSAVSATRERMLLDNGSSPSLLGVHLDLVELTALPLAPRADGISLACRNSVVTGNTCVTSLYMLFKSES